MSGTMLSPGYKNGEFAYTWSLLSRNSQSNGRKTRKKTLIWYCSGEGVNRILRSSWRGRCYVKLASLRKVMPKMSLKNWVDLAK